MSDTTAEELKRRLTPTHLQEAQTTEDLVNQADGLITAPDQVAKAADPSKDPRAQNPYTFQFEWRGKHDTKDIGNTNGPDIDQQLHHGHKLAS